MKVSKGMFYLFKERVPLRTHQVVRRELSQGRKALYISKNAPELLRSQLDFDQTKLATRWLSPRTEESCIPPMNLDILESEIRRFILMNRDGLIILNGLDVLEKWNGWWPVLDVLKRTEKVILRDDGNLIISLDPKSHYPLMLRKLEIISDEVVSSCT